MIGAAQRGSCSGVVSRGARTAAMIQDFIFSGGALDLLLVVGEIAGQLGMVEVSENGNGRVGVRSFNRRDLISQFIDCSGSICLWQDVNTNHYYRCKFTWKIEGPAVNNDGFQLSRAGFV